MIYFKLRYKVLGGHTHVRLFSGTRLDGTFGKNGDLIFRNEEWEEFLRQFQKAVVLPEEEPLSREMKS